jgi:D-hexose-6-phosphate mutarotase
MGASNVQAVEHLQERFGIADELNFEIGGEGAPIADVRNSQCRGRIALQGAQVLGWYPLGQGPVIWLSPGTRFQAGKPLRGGVPICWPWFGPHPDDPKKTSHGFARNLDWDLRGTATTPTGTRITLSLTAGAAQRELWPSPAELTLTVVFGERLHLSLETRNTGDRPFTLSQALHTYFRVGDIGAVQIVGLDGCDYVDKVSGGAVRQQRGVVTIDGEVDRIYTGCPGDIEIIDRSMRRRVRVSKRGSDSYVVWNPWVDKAATLGDMGENGHRNMVCVETTNAGEDIVTLAPGDTHRLLTEYAVAPLETA